MVNPQFETPMGALIALIGVPFFLYLARKQGRGCKRCSKRQHEFRLPL
jgi:hypothetical protein